MTDIVDAHHHIWRQADMPWLSGPMLPRIFGPYAAIRRDYLIDEFLEDLAGTGVVKSVYVQANWPPLRAETFSSPTPAACGTEARLAKAPPSPPLGSNEPFDRPWYAPCRLRPGRSYRNSPPRRPVSGVGTRMGARPGSGRALGLK
jgi:hypothetical protein